MKKKYLNKLLRQQIALHEFETVNLLPKTNKLPSLLPNEESGNTMKSFPHPLYSDVQISPFHPVETEDKMIGITADNVLPCGKTKNSLSRNLAHWAVSSHISQTKLTELLRILKKPWLISEFKNLPLDSRSLLKTKPILNIVEFEEGGKYYHFGLETSVSYILNTCKFDVNLACEDLLIDINVDGLPLAHSSNSQLWPIMGNLVLCYLDKPFVIGVYHATSKPISSNHLLSELIKEFHQIQESGFLYKKKYTI